MLKFRIRYLSAMELGHMPKFKQEVFER